MYRERGAIMLQQCLQSTVQAPVGAVITEIVLSQDGKTLGNPTSLTPPFIRAKCTHLPFYLGNKQRSNCCYKLGQHWNVYLGDNNKKNKFSCKKIRSTIAKPKKAEKELLPSASWYCKFINSICCTLGFLWKSAKVYWILKLLSDCKIGRIFHIPILLYEICGCGQW